MTDQEELVDRILDMNGKWVLFRKTENGDAAEDGTRMDGGIALPSMIANNTNFVEIIAVGPECDHFCDADSLWWWHAQEDYETRGATTFHPERKNKMFCISDSIDDGYWISHEKNFLAVIVGDDGRVEARGRFVCVEMDNDEADKLYGDIEVRDEIKYSTFANHTGRVSNCGTSVVDVHTGDRVMIPGNQHVFEANDKMVAVVDETDILALVGA